MEKSFSCFVNRLLDLHLFAGNQPHGKSLQQSGSDMFELLPYMAIPLLVVMIGGLYFMSLYRRKLSGNSTTQSSAI